MKRHAFVPPPAPPFGRAVTAPAASWARVATWTGVSLASDAWKRPSAAGCSTSAALASVPVPHTTKLLGTRSVTS